jgi:hypothetical protein
MAIINEDIVALASAFHDASMVKKSTAAQMAEFFLYPESRIFVLHGGDLTLQANHEIHQKLVDEIHWTVGTWDIARRQPRAGAGAGYRLLAGPPRRLGRRRAAQMPCGRGLGGRTGASGELKFVIYVNSFHRFLPDAAPIEIR